MVSWGDVIRDFESYLRLERALSINSVKSYVSDLNKFASYCLENNGGNFLEDISVSKIEEYLVKYVEEGNSKRSQARLLSSLKAFDRFVRSSNYGKRADDVGIEGIATPKSSMFV